MITATLVAGLAPMKVLRYLRRSAALASSSRQHRHVSLVLCLLTCFSGGVFLATCFLHLFPELVENVRKLDELYNFYIDYPVAELLSCAGFFLLFFLEEVVIMAIPSLAHSHSHGGHGHGFSLGESSPLTKQEVGGCCMTGNYVPPPTSTEANEHCVEATSELIKENERENSTDGEEGAGHCQKHCPLTVHRGKLEKVVELHARAAVLVRHIRVNEDPPILMKSSPHAHSHGVRSITFVLALSIHSVIEGIALGVGDNASETTALFLSLLVHKLIVAFSVGLQLARTHAHQLQWVVASVFTFALMSPLGAIIGMAVQSAAANSFSKDLTVTVLQGLAVGTFLYVTFFEVLLHERDNEHPNLLKLLVMLIGFSMIGLLRLIDNHDHSDLSHSLVNSTQIGAMRGAHFGHHHHHDHHGSFSLIASFIPTF
ncbi:metal cation transporter, ZIP family [Ancylostoma ceylanicum]|uniref:Metal cation transporter, ZIP family n=1 Tax=Ancylostoma ceylanicum TaxID=53326 RepID=A0A0D6L6T6_9BILA|nr:metal cation transporter, ZIP family [Ancylostoma ceylanicum]